MKKEMMKEMVDVSFDFYIRAEELPDICANLMKAGFDPEMVFNTIKKRLKTLTDYRRDVVEFCAIIRAFIPFMEPDVLVCMANDGVYRHEGELGCDDGSFMIDLYKEWQRQGQPPDAAMYFLQLSFSWPEYVSKNFVKILGDLGLEVNDLLWQLGPSEFEMLYDYYCPNPYADEDGVSSFFHDFKYADGDVSALANRFVEVANWKGKNEYREMFEEIGVNQEVIDKL